MIAEVGGLSKPLAGVVSERNNTAIVYLHQTMERYCRVGWSVRFPVAKFNMSTCRMLRDLSAVDL